MALEHCFKSVCFVHLNANAPKFFGFSEFLAGLALIVLAWTIADIRYRFRVRTAPIPLQAITFWMVVTVGLLTLLTDLWRSEQWLVPEGDLLTPAIWQAFLGALFFFTFLAWAWFAFIRPPQYGKYNAQRYIEVLYHAIIKGAPAELSVIADELSRSAESLIHFAPENRDKHDEDTIPRKLDKVEGYANDILLLIGDKRFCREIVNSSPGTALAIFSAINVTKKYRIQMRPFAKNIVLEALENKNSFLYLETEWFDTGLIGYVKPLSTAMFGNYRMVDTIGDMLDVDLWKDGGWNSKQWQAYCRMVLITIKDYVDNGYDCHSSVLYRARGYIEKATYDLYKLDGADESAWNDDLFSTLRVVVQFVKDTVSLLDEKGAPKNLGFNSRDKLGRLNILCDYLATVIFEIILSTAAVRSPYSLSRAAQYDHVWSALFKYDGLNSTAGKIVKYRVRRLLYDEIVHMNDFPNFRGAKALRFCLNVMGLQISVQPYEKDVDVFQKVILGWTKKNYARLHHATPHVAEACLVDGTTYDEENNRLVKTLKLNNMMRETRHIYFDLDPAEEKK